MFSSLATFLFGAQPPTTTSEPTTTNTTSDDNQVNPNDLNSGDVIEVTSSTPSVAGNNRGTVRSASGKQRNAKNRRGKNRQQQQHHEHQSVGQRKPPTLTKLLTSVDDDFDEDDWYIVEKEEEDDDSLPRTDSEEELTVVEVQGATKVAQGGSTGSRRRQHINSHSLYSGPRPQQQRNYLQRAARAAAATNTTRPLTVSTLSPSRPLASSAGGDNGVTQSLYVVSPAVSPCGSDQAGTGTGNGSGTGANVQMEESWYVTPPPCFTSIGPINMETSPFENLLIEHPSMSVYHSIRSTREGTESFVNLDLGGVLEPEAKPLQEDEEPAVDLVEVQQQQQQQLRQYNNSARYDRQAAVQLKQESLARQSQKNKNKKQHQELCRSAIKRSNKVREYQAKANRPRRSDMQHAKIASGVNNNRKCCY